MALRPILPPPNQFGMQHFIIKVCTSILHLPLQTLRAAEAHLQATTERSYYRTAVKESKDKVHTFTADDVFTPPPVGGALASGTGPRRVHYSFDFAQQVHYPHNPLQPGPIYFKTPRKCAVFGVCCEAIPRQVNYLIDEASDTGKGANTVVTLLHHFLGHHSLGECELALHADNCTGQNKNNTVLQVNLGEGRHRDLGMPLDILRFLQTSLGMQKLTHSPWLSSLCNLAVEHEVVTYNFFPLSIWHGECWSG